MRNLVIAARQSDLARLQAYRVGDALKRVNPDLAIEYRFRASLGDLNQNDPLWKMPEKGVFTEDFLKDLTTGSADLVVHSFKDLPTEERHDTEIVATLPRADLRDLLLFRKDRLAKAAETGRVRILTSSPRRAYNLAAFLKDHLPFGSRLRDLEFESVRGNIPTRLKKMMSQEVEGLIVAKAAIDRLLEAPEAEFTEVQTVIRSILAQAKFMVLPLTANPTAAAQGAIAIEIAKNRHDLRELLQPINCPTTLESVLEERRTLSRYGGGCHQKIGVSILKRSFGDMVYLRGLTDQGEVLNQAQLRADRGELVVEDEDRVYPRIGEEPTFFARETLSRDSWGSVVHERFLWVARESAWPQELAQDDQQIVWTAGLKTWGHLAKRGIWVSGSSESLGEDEAPRLQALLGLVEIPWAKLSHQESGRFTSVLGRDGHAAGANARSGRLYATYRLVEKSPESSPRLTGRSHFYWMSASSFARALELFPEIRSGHHSCGPGNTAHYLRKVLGEGAKIDIFLSVEDWREALQTR